MTDLGVVLCVEELYICCEWSAVLGYWFKAGVFDCVFTLVSLSSKGCLAFSVCRHVMQLKFWWILPCETVILCDYVCQFNWTFKWISLSFLFLCTGQDKLACGYKAELGSPRAEVITSSVHACDWPKSAASNSKGCQ